MNISNIGSVLDEIKLALKGKKKIILFGISFLFYILIIL